jgi:hypothetical protein
MVTPDQLRSVAHQSPRLLERIAIALIRASNNGFGLRPMRDDPDDRGSSRVISVLLFLAPPDHEITRERLVGNAHRVVAILPAHRTVRSTNDEVD